MTTEKSLPVQARTECLDEQENEVVKQNEENRKQYRQEVSVLSQEEEREAAENERTGSTVQLPHQ